MSTDIKGLTERIVAKADADLNVELDGIFNAAGRLINNGIIQHIVVDPVGNSEMRVTINAHVALKAVRDLAFSIRAPVARQKAIDNFMSRVDSLGRDVQALRNLEVDA